MKFPLILVFLFGYFMTCESRLFMRITKINCEISRKTIPEQPTCFIKTYKKQSYITIKLNITRKVPNLLLSYNTSRKNSDGYTKFLELKDLEFCKIFRSKTLSFDGIVGLIAESVIKLIDGNVFEVCTKKEGEKSVNNLTFTSILSLFQAFPAGEYLNSLHFYDKNDENVATINLYVYAQFIKK